MLENPMVSGYGFPDEPMPITDCDKCGMEMYRGDVVFEWDTDLICSDCLREEVHGLTLAEKAEMTGESQAHTYQMLEYAYTTPAIAEILNITSVEVTE